MGYIYKNALSPGHWFQFGDDIALATATQEDSQALLNSFSKCCQWADFKICIDKCRCFGIKKNEKQSTQFRPYLILAVKYTTFVYLGKEFRYNMSCESVKRDLVKRLSNNLEKINILSLYPKHKINIFTKFVYSNLRWDLTVYHFSETWIVQNLDNKANRYSVHGLVYRFHGALTTFVLNSNSLVSV